MRFRIVSARAGAAPTGGAAVDLLAAGSTWPLAVKLGCAAFAAALTAAAAQMSVPLRVTPVPLTLQPLVVLLTAATLGARFGFLSQSVYLAAGVAGLPVFAWSPVLPPGPARLLGPTGGFLLAFPLAAWVTGWLAERGGDRRYPGAVLAMAAGLAVIYAGGALWLGVLHSRPGGLQTALQMGVYPFLLPDAIKLLVAAGLLPASRRLVERLVSHS